MKMFNLGKTVCIVLAFFGLIFDQAYANDFLEVDNLNVKKNLTISGNVETNFINNIHLDPHSFITDNAFLLSSTDGHKVIFMCEGNIRFGNLGEFVGILIEKDGLFLGNYDHPEVLIDKADGNLHVSNDVVVSKDIELTGTSNNIESETYLNIKSGGDICIGNCD